MCTNYTDLNKVYPKDTYLLPSIDCLVDDAVDHYILYFLHAYSGYKQIRMPLRDTKKIAFMIDCDNFYYEVT